MATWQYDVFLKPRKSNDEIAVDEISRAMGRVTVAVQSEYGKAARWQRDSHEFSVYSHGNVVRELDIRFDLRCEQDSLLTAAQITVDLAQEFELVMTDREESPQPVEVERLIGIINHSDAARFVKDPRGLLEGLQGQ